MDGHAIYFVGAGLPRALQQPDFPVPLMWDFVSVAASYAATDDVLLTTLTQLEIGGVFEHSTPQSIALAAKVAPPSTATAAERAEFLQAISSRRPENIEQLLIRASELAKAPTKVVLDRTTLKLLPLRFSFAINRVFAHIGWSFSASPLRRFLGGELHTFERATFVSFNYDLMLEHGIEDVAPDAWCATTGYGTAFEEFVEADEGNKHLRRRGSGGQGSLRSHTTTRASSGRIVVLKPHGSLNWLCRFADNYAFVGYPTHLVLSVDERVAYLGGNNVELLERPNGWPWPNAGVFISPPTQKTPLPTILTQEEEAIVDADDVLIIGWSAPATDEDQVALIKRAIARRRRPFRRVTLIEWNPARFQVRRMRELFAPSTTFTLWVGGFQTYATHTPLTWLSSRLRWWALRRAWS
ncbi:MAG TPA: hypothetical protein VLC46_00690 [Thermoanaerobaculia bacterium]|nr:hypothetical protein [Thermoanaerobaculia bacterium]